MSKSLPYSIAWIAFAIAAAAAFIWPTPLRLSGITDAPAAPVKTRHSIRTFDATVEALGDYRARCQKGLTVREVGWIVADFRSAGLDQVPDLTSPAACVERRWKQQRWYRGALIDGLRLGREQSSQLAANLAKNLDQAAARLNPNSSPESMRPWVSPSEWLSDDAVEYQPWNLCTLTAEQEQIPQRMPSCDSVAAISSPFSSFQPIHIQRAVPTAPFPSANRLFPLTRQQRIASQPNPLDTRTDQSAEVLVSQIRSLHPAQLKMLLLFEPAMAAQIQQALEIADAPFVR